MLLLSREANGAWAPGRAARLGFLSGSQAAAAFPAVTLAWLSQRAAVSTPRVGAADMQSWELSVLGQEQPRLPAGARLFLTRNHGRKNTFHCDSVHPAMGVYLNINIFN